MDKNMTLCVILHYGDEGVTWDCVNSIIAHNFLDILIADNDPAQKIQVLQQYTNKVRIIRTGGEASFAHANNMTVRAGRNATHRSVLLLNNDTVVMSDAVQRLREMLDTERVGAVGPCMPLASCPDQIWACGGAIRKFRVAIHGLVEIAKSKPYDVDYLPGAAILCRLSVWDLVGGMPEKYYFAYEEAEFALRIRKQKFRIIVLPEARILHKVGMSSDKQPMYIYNDIRNRLKFGRFLWGKLPGFLLAAFWNLIGLRNTSYGLALWSRAVFDEIRGVALNLATLLEVKRDFTQPM
jgi:GT2 family glycosyltransferase